MLVPEGGFCRKLDAMHQFTPATEYGRSRREGGRDYIRWCFADSGIAVDFADEFGGQSATKAVAAISRGGSGLPSIVGDTYN
jgi:hypothetical protein